MASEEDQDLSPVDSFLTRLRVSLGFSALTENISNFAQAKLQELQDFITQRIQSLGNKDAQRVLESEESDSEDDEEEEEEEEEGEEDNEGEEGEEQEIPAEQVEIIKAEIEQKTKEIQEQIEAHTQDEFKEVKKSIKLSTGQGKLSEIMQDVHELLRESTTVAVQRKAWRDFVDPDTIHESTGLYVVESTPGYFENTHVPAWMMVNVCTFLIDALLEENNDKKLALLEKASVKYEEAWWVGVDANTKEAKKGFNKLRRDVNAMGEKSYNERLGRIVFNSESIKNAMPPTDKINRNIYNAMKQIGIVCSTIDTDPLHTTFEEQTKSLAKIEKSLSFAISRQQRL